MCYDCYNLPFFGLWYVENVDNYSLFDYNIRNTDQLYSESDFYSRVLNAIISLGHCPAF